jgi:hypothetical protein
VWCLKLNDLMTSDKAISRMLATNYEVVHVDAGKPDGKNVDLANSYGATPDKDGYPFLTILDGDGKAIQNQESGSLEMGNLVVRATIRRRCWRCCGRTRSIRRRAN